MIATLLLPPGGPLLLVLSGWLLSRRRRRPALGLFWVGWLALYFLSIPVGSHTLSAMIQRHQAIAPKQLTQIDAEAIVVLAGGLDSDAYEYGGDTVGLLTLARARYAAYIARRSGLPILVSGGGVNPLAAEPAAREADLIAKMLNDEFQITVRWRENQSRNTYENALNSSQILNDAGIQHIVLVTHGVHMVRAEREFSRRGFQVIAAPTQLFDTDFKWRLRDWIPRIDALWRCHYLLYEWLGGLWYAIRLA